MTGLVGLYKRGSVWTYRLRVPSDIQSIIGKKELKKSLKTKDYRLAVVRYRRVCSEIEIRLEDARNKILLSEKRTTNLDHRTGPQLSDLGQIPTSDSAPHVSDANQKHDLKSIIKLVAEEVLSSFKKNEPESELCMILR